MLPIGKAHHDDLRRILSKPWPHVFRDAVLPISFVGPHVVELLISHPNNNPIPESYSSLTLTTTHEATTMNIIDYMEFLIESFGDNEIDVNSVDSNGRNPIHVAAIQGHVEVIEFCVLIGGNPNYVDMKGWTPLHYATSEGHLKAVECLLECSNVKKVRNKDGKTAFLVAKENGHSHLFDLLHWGDELVRVVKVDDVHGLERCIEEGAKVNRRDHNGWTPLHWAAFKGRIKSLKVLLEHGAEVDAVDGEREERRVCGT